MYNSSMNKNPHGFTIVELLVVIVVIAILAAITLVSYNGIRNRAYNTSTITSVKQWTDFLASSLVLNGPVEVTMENEDDFAICLGVPSQYPDESDDLEEGRCGYSAYVTPDLAGYLDDIGTIGVSSRVIDDGDYPVRGLQYYMYYPNETSHIWYVLAGDDQDCGLASTVVDGDYNVDGFTGCILNVTNAIGGNPILN